MIHKRVIVSTVSRPTKYTKDEHNSLLMAFYLETIIAQIRFLKKQAAPDQELIKKKLMNNAISSRGNITGDKKLQTFSPTLCSWYDLHTL